MRFQIKPGKPNPEFVAKYTKKNINNSFKIVDSTLSLLFTTFPNNREIEHILIKVSTLNDLYATRIYAVGSLAYNIQRLNIDPLLEEENLSCVDLIDKNGLEKRSVYSFATKYCSWHKPDIFPIFDQYVAAILWHFSNHELNQALPESALRNYSTFCNLLLSYRQHFGLMDFSIKEIDKFLWSYGKECVLGNSK
jgi:hypothetical protein